MTVNEIKSHRKKLVDDGWLQNGKILQLWVDDEYHISYYVVLFTPEDQGDGYHGVSIRCFRVYGSDNEDHNVGIPVGISCDQDVDVGFQHGSDIPTITIRQSRNWTPAEGYER